MRTFILEEMAELLTKYDHTYLDTLPVAFLNVKLDRVQQQLQELR